MKKITHLSLLLLCIATGALAQTPIYRPVQPIGRLDNPPVINLYRGMTRYDATAGVKYIFYDDVHMNEVTGRMPQDGDYITLGAIVNGKEYTLVPQND